MWEISMIRALAILSLFCLFYPLHAQDVEKNLACYSHSLKQSEIAEDTLKNTYVRFGDFALLVWQASKDNEQDAKPFRELVHRIRTGEIDTRNQLVAITKKDCDHRLLSYIPKKDTFALIDDKRIDIMFRQHTIKKLIKERKLEEPLESPELLPFLEDKRFGSNKSWDLEFTAERELTIIYIDPITDKERSTIAEGFLKLIQD
jgi:hypothetical protein